MQVCLGRLKKLEAIVQKQWQGRTYVPAQKDWSVGNVLLSLFYSFQAVSLLVGSANYQDGSLPLGLLSCIQVSYPQTQPELCFTNLLGVSYFSQADISQLMVTLSVLCQRKYRNAAFEV